MYAADASLYRVVPAAVARPRTVDELVAAVEVARSLGVPVTMRGAGTSIAGNAVGPGLVIDTARHLRRVLSLDPEARVARVEPGVVHAQLQGLALAEGLRFGPDPSTHTRCTIGGMLGNNSCGSRALGFGRTSDNVVGMRVLLGTGEVISTDAPGAVAGDLASVVDANLAHVRTQFGRFSRQGSGYALEHLLPENGRRLDRFLVGSEGTLGVVLEATVALVPDPVHRVLLVLGHASMADAADTVPGLLESVPLHSPGGSGLLALEGIDARIVDVVRAQGRAVPELPRGVGWLIAELTGSTVGEAVAHARGLAAWASGAGALDHRIVIDTAEQDALWRIREDGAGLAGRSLGRPAYSGWEDAAVPPARLGSWLREFDALLGEHGLSGVPYGHFGDGCVHARIDFTFDDGGARFRSFLTDAAHAVAAYGGSLSGEHGDGRARSELLPALYDAQSLALFREVKRICDPEGLLNPGVLVDPAPLDADLRPAREVHEPRTFLRLAGESLGEAVHRCTGVGKCLATSGGGGVMCPSYVATRDEKDSTRGRARVLQEALDGSLVHGLDDPAVHEALDLCLACKGCSRDCPAGVDMAAYKAEALQATWRGRRRPRSHYTLGRLPFWARVTPPGLANRALARPVLARIAQRMAGVDPQRTMPSFAPTRLQDLAAGWFSSRPDGRPDVWVWADTFTDRFTPGPGLAAIRLLQDAGLEVRVIPADACCGLTLVSTGQLDAARKVMTRTVDRLHPYVASGVPVLGLEPSCLATLRDDLSRLVDGSNAATVAAGVLTLAEALTGPLAAPLANAGWSLPDLSGVEIVAQPHCHHASVLGWETDEGLLKAAGATVTRVGGCCGLAGNFGVEAGHHEISVAIAETSLLPAVRSAGPEAVVVADGFSCRYQLADLADVRAVHLAELLSGNQS
ncbi:FAD-binding oxidoreductase [Nocardioides cavernaquae]|uniref:FAD-binding oxidoreductase n=2 Tax=Nocardioides cavernaquae TaxID=2321396 RepID=A0A3A5HB54_9ACTN|nr:FAD-binding oxidoreductase [Nocardioides cavernaquae]